MTALPISGSQFDRLGKRLADGTATDDDVEVFENVRLAYGRVLAAAQAGLEAAGFTATGRVKTTGTLIDKLRRTSGLTIRGVHDLAGARIIVPERTIAAGLRVEGQVLARDVRLCSGWYAQDIAVKQLASAFATFCTKEPKIINRREQPSAGYRAIHLVIFLEGIPVEIQVRTELQHAWAEVAERLGDTWGRGLRYGEGPEEPETVAIPADPPITRRAIVDALIGVAERVATHEGAHYRLEVAEMALGFREDQSMPEVQGLWHDVEELRSSLQLGDAELRTVLSNFLKMVEMLGRS